MMDFITKLLAVTIAMGTSLPMLLLEKYILKKLVF